MVRTAFPICVNDTPRLASDGVERRVLAALRSPDKAVGSHGTGDPDQCDAEVAHRGAKGGDFRGDGGGVLLVHAAQRTPLCRADGIGGQANC